MRYNGLITQNRSDGDNQSNGAVDLSRRSVLGLSGALGAAGLATFPAVEAAESDDDETDRAQGAEEIDGTIVSGSETSTEFADAIASSDIQNQIVSSVFRGASEQGERFSQSLQGFPQSGESYIVLSSGRASDAPGDPETFSNVAISNGRSNQDYSPDGYDAYNIVDLEITISVPDDAQGIEFDYKFATEENPEYLESEFQDFFEVQFYDPDGTVQNLALIDGKPVTVQNADTISNSPGGTSPNPEPPLPSPEDVVYNSVTELQTVTYDVSDYQGESITLVFRVADASDRFYDSAAFIDGLQFTNDVETDPTPVRNALDKYEQNFKQYIKRRFEAQGEYLARLYDEHGDEYGDRLTSYWGYKSGNLSESAVDDGVREVSDGTIDTLAEKGNLEVTEGDAQVLYDFYNELFSQLSESDPLQQHVQTATQFFLGTYPDQSNYLKFDDGQTVADGLNQNWNLSTDVYNQLNEDLDLSQSDIQRIADAIDRRGDRIASRGRQDIQSKRKAANELISVGEQKSAELHARRFEQPTDGEVQGEVTPSTAFMGILLLVGAGGLAAGYITNKCSGALVAAQAEGVEFNAVTLTRPDQAIIGTVTTILNQGSAIKNYGEYASGEVQSASFSTALFTTNFIAGQKAAAADLALETAAVFNQAALSEQVAAEITDLELPNITETEEMGMLQSFVNSVKSFFDDLLGGWYNYSPPQIGAATGSVTVSTENPVGDSPITFKPSFVGDYKLFDGKELAGSGHPFEVKGDMSTMETGEQRTFDIEYKAPLDQGLLSGEGSIKFGVSPVSQTPVTSKSDVFPVGICELDLDAIPKASATAEFTVNDAVENQTVAQNQGQSGQTYSYTYTPQSNTNQSLLTLNYDGYYSDLHLYDSQDNEVGYDYGSNSVVNEIPGATYSGRDTGQTNSEWVSFPVNNEEEYTVEIVTPEVGTVGQSAVTGADASSLVSDYGVSSTEVGDLPPKLSIAPSNVIITEDISPGDSIDLSLTLDEVNDAGTVEDISFSSTDLTADSGAIDGSNVTFDANNIAVSSPREVGYTIEIPESVDDGTYTGTFTLSSSNAESVTVDVELQITTQYFDGITAKYNTDGDQDIDAKELGQAVVDYGKGNITAAELGQVVVTYSSSN